MQSARQDTQAVLCPLQSEMTEMCTRMSLVDVPVSLTERLIECVKARSVLYDIRHPDFKQFNEKDKIWREIGSELKQDSEDLKKKWKNIKDCYIKHLRTLNRKSAQQITLRRSYKNWQWANLMEFCRPQIESSMRFNDSTYSDTQTDPAQSPNEDSEGFENLGEGTSMSHNRYEYKRQRTSETQSRSEHLIPSDGTDLIFLGYSRTIKKFSPLRQAIVKARIAQIVMEEEIKNLEERNKDSETSPEFQETIFSDSLPCSSDLHTEIMMKHEKEDSDT